MPWHPIALTLVALPRLDRSASPAAAALAQVHAASTHQQALCQLMDLALAPAQLALTYQEAQAQLQRRQLEEQLAWLQVGGLPG